MQITPNQNIRALRDCRGKRGMGDANIYSYEEFFLLSGTFLILHRFRYISPIVSIFFFDETNIFTTQIKQNLKVLNKNIHILLILNNFLVKNLMSASQICFLVTIIESAPCATKFHFKHLYSLQVT